MQAYVRRRLEEAISVKGSRSYVRAWVPGITTGDVVSATLPEARLAGRMRIVEQRITIGAGATVEETVEVIE